MRYLRNLFLILLVSCDGSLYTPEPPRYGCPYEDTSEAEQYIASEIKVPWEVLNPPGTINERLAEVTIFGNIRMYEDLSGRYYEDYREHEVCHTYEFRVLNISWENTLAHIGWKDNDKR